MQPYVHACHTGRWTIETWRRDSPGESRRRFVYRCRSWRHEGKCRLWCGACDYERIKEAVLKRSRWTYLVLTYGGKARLNHWRIFREGNAKWYSLRKRLEKEFGTVRYIQTWETQRDGTPHLNTIIQCTRLFNALADAHRAIKRGWLEPAAIASGFGKISYCEAVKSRGRKANYLTKLTQELTGAGVKSQVPVNAPRHFRRIRASKGLLPPRRKDPDLTGRLIRGPCPPSPGTGIVPEYGVE